MGGLGPLVLPGPRILRSDNQMDDSALSQALERAERALARIERALAARSHQTRDSEQQLRSKVREAVAELDELIRASEQTKAAETQDG